MIFNSYVSLPEGNPFPMVFNFTGPCWKLQSNGCKSTNRQSHSKYPHQIIIYSSQMSTGFYWFIKKNTQQFVWSRLLKVPSDATCFRRPRIPCRPLLPKGGKETAGSCRSFFWDPMRENGCVFNISRYILEYQQYTYIILYTWINDDQLIYIYIYTPN